MTVLSVNVNKIAVLRNSRGGREPSVGAAALAVIEAGCAGITVHPRPDLRRDSAALRPLIAEFKARGARVSLFMDAGAPALELAAEIGADRIELYTGPFAEAYAAGDAVRELARCAGTAAAARSLGLGVNAGHDLSQANLAAFLEAVPGVDEVSIGHALISEALYSGLKDTVRAYLAILASH
jgi:pyridoxine 5-phosphate synthase